jgi:hypothetical protein
MSGISISPNLKITRSGSARIKVKPVSSKCLYLLDFDNEDDVKLTKAGLE